MAGIKVLEVGHYGCDVLRTAPFVEGGVVVGGRFEVV